MIKSTFKSLVYRIFDDEGAEIVWEILTYLFAYAMLNLAIMYLIQHRRQRFAVVESKETK